MIDRRRLGRAALPALMVLALAGCAELIPDVSLRDDYLGKSFLQPGHVPTTVDRDEFGDPILGARRFPNTFTFRFLDPFRY